MDEKPISTDGMSDMENLIFKMRTYRIKGLTVKEASLELGVSVRTVFRMLKDGRLKAEKYGLTESRGFFWLIDPMSVAKILVRREMELEQKAKKEAGK